MKNLLLSLFAIPFFFACNEKTNNKTTDTTEWRTISQPGYTLSYPFDWELSTEGLVGTSFILFSPLSDEKDQFKENINLLIQDLSATDLDLDKFTKLSEEQVRTLVKNGKIQESKRLEKNGMPYQVIRYTGTQGPFNMLFEQFYWVVDKHAYILTFTAEERKFEEYKTTAEKILNSFELKKS